LAPGPLPRDFRFGTRRDPSLAFAPDEAPTRRDHVTKNATKATTTGTKLDDVDLEPLGLVDLAPGEAETVNGGASMDPLPVWSWSFPHRY
jgi:hypothetical protein